MEQEPMSVEIPNVSPEQLDKIRELDQLEGLIQALRHVEYDTPERQKVLVEAIKTAHEQIRTMMERLKF
ncbi:MAG: hypothetical protein A3B86_01760 [Candidatus Yanofskybacteria bacterium RIFCSPHIGHO2_02_FULL_38_22b]|uniref:Uncharacterized protein n=1 Tax=Candidatus Yanofskybacteria bacterium RIFCSPHIGHO2_02_FULL_38_22b TaxID=1802673 RepID=A0A1F8F4E8_9BACT|nr:MAG: hypothetical protein A2816_00660 [Candidatus Yanofskybacteria bacterium RIFCSPHIGHO2_01_FULL_39_44]OGN07116.1 MAG: hypothetical protein A3B86_01760 [Candidatus Yanofskybacteria bacterium RIFCSPHIGHO2_02_FULL_38_22b]OGN19966.1 MAG: hypothetical protein A2910_00470 [Candidatus Yanofskybacteria bacterium RIFCSPLOWO2_01_FULL_39_28]